MVIFHLPPSCLSTSKIQFLRSWKRIWLAEECCIVVCFAFFISQFLLFAITKDWFWTNGEKWKLGTGEFEFGWECKAGSEARRVVLGSLKHPNAASPCSYVMTYAMVVGLLGADGVHSRVGMEPSGRQFNELCLDYNSMSQSPLISPHSPSWMLLTAHSPLLSFPLKQKEIW